MHIEAIELLRTFHIKLKNKLGMKMNFLPLRTDSPRIKIHLKRELIQSATKISHG